MRKYLVAPNAFKGTLSPLEAARAIREGILEVEPNACVDIHPITDGGDGFVSCIKHILGGEFITCKGIAPFGNEIDIPILLNRNRAYIESAKCFGFSTISHLDPMSASSTGLAGAISEAVRVGATEIYIGLGGSVSVDLGTGFADILGVNFTDFSGNSVLPRGGKDLISISSCNIPTDMLKTVKIYGICDVSVPLCGQNGGIQLFSPQKGATTEQTELLEAQAIRLGRVFDEISGKRASKFAGSGAAGGAGAALSWFFDAELLPGFSWYCEQTSLKVKLEEYDVVITGEGAFDATSYAGKATSELVKTLLGKIPTVIIMCGICPEKPEVSHVFEINYLNGESPTSTLDAYKALRRTSTCIKEALK